MQRVVLSTYTGDLYVPNSDSIGLLLTLNDDDFTFVVNWQIVTQTLVEISGRFAPENIGLQSGVYQREIVRENMTETFEAFVFALQPYQSVLLKIKK